MRQAGMTHADSLLFSCSICISYVARKSVIAIDLNAFGADLDKLDLAV
jgi:hypothetical protein